ncbi:MAG: SPFH domain-containing protein [Fimbriimonadaceae bacterium]|nr:SPFH domain-containing protein [Fimbriimonadaceae bacterium]QYK56343.1 MAG: SPFH domain-containing protein [Fimbriimonadaceae bacterium]
MADLIPVSESTLSSKSSRSLGAGETVNMPNPLQPIIFLGLTGAGIAASFEMFASSQGALVAGIIVSVLVGGLAASAFRMAAQWEKALVFRLGRYKRLAGPGMFFIVPVIDSVRTVDTRIVTIDIPHRQAITKDNVPVRVDGVIFMRVDDPSAAVIRVQNYRRAVLEYAQTALRDIVGAMTLDEILADRELLGRRVEKMVETEINGWGLDVAAIRIQDIELPEDLKRVMARQASAEREKRATITKAEGDREAAENLAAAAERMAKSPGALQLRTLQSLDSLGASPSNTVVIALPTELTTALQQVPKIAEAFRVASGQKKDAE